MPIRFRCPACQQVLSVTSRKAGQKVRCPACQSALRVPTPKAETPPEPAAAQVEDPAPAPPPAPVEDPTPAPASEPLGEPAPEPAVSGSDGAEGLSESIDESADTREATAATSSFFSVVEDEPESEEEEFELRRARIEFEEMDLTPMVDVTFLLLIFFMITASFTMQKAISFPPPSPDEQGASVQPKQLEDFEDECVIVEIHEDNSISIDEERIPLDANLAAMLAIKGKNEMLIDAHENALHETVVKVVDAGNEVQMQRIRLGSRGG